MVNSATVTASDGCVILASDIAELKVNRNAATYTIRDVRGVGHVQFLRGGESMVDNLRDLLTATPDGWVPVTEIPVFIVGKRYLAARGKTVTVVHWTGNEWRNERTMGFAAFNPTHLMEIPKPPQE